MGESKAELKEQAIAQAKKLTLLLNALIEDKNISGEIPYRQVGKLINQRTYNNPDIDYMPLSVGEMSRLKSDEVGYLSYSKFYGKGDFFEGESYVVRVNVNQHYQESVGVLSYNGPLRDIDISAGDFNGDFFTQLYEF